MASKEPVFISSVAMGMEGYREAVRGAVESLDGYHALTMENFGARDMPSLEACERKVNECSLFVGIVGHQYGSTHDIAGKSYSELEFDLAVKLEKRRLVFVAPEDFPVQAHLVESDYKREQQRAFRKKVLADRQVAFFNDRDDLGSKVLQAIHNCEATLKDNLAATGTTTKRTRLLYPYVTNIQGFDTGIVISNVSRDPGEITPVHGIALLNFYGLDAPAVSQTTPIAPGEVFTTLTSVCAPGFNGYLYVFCKFWPARGFGFITDIGARNLAAGYLAEATELDS